MKKAPKGYYRTLLKDKFPEVRIALTNQPIVGCTEIPQEPIISELKKSNDEYADYYINGLLNREMKTIIEDASGKDYFKPGELYFKS